MRRHSGLHAVNGLRLFVHRFQDPDVRPSGLTVLLIHGFLDAGATWDRVATRLAAAGHDVVAPDLRGYGQSDWVGAGGYYHFPDYVADLSALVDTLAPSRLAIVGHSMGGTVAALLAGARPDLPVRLALLEGLGPVATEPTLALDRMRAWLGQLPKAPREPRALASMQDAMERLAHYHPRVPREVLETRAPLLTRTDAAGRVSWAYDPLHRTTAPTPFNAETFRAFLVNIACPTLVVGGGPLGWHVPDEEERVACIPKTERFELPDAGHMMHWTEPAALAARLVAFFAGA